MLFPALRICLAILFLRAGPQDMPYDTSPRLVREVALFALACYAAFWLMVFPLLPAVMLSALVILAQWLTVRATLASRNLQNRFQQTLTALLLTNGLLTLAMLPFFAVLAPHWQAMLDQLQQHQDLINHPEKLPLPPPGPTAAFDLLAIWQFVVSVRIFGRAMDVGVLGAILITLLVMMATSLFVTFMSPLVTILG